MKHLFFALCLVPAGLMASELAAPLGPTAAVPSAPSAASPVASAVAASPVAGSEADDVSSDAQAEDADSVGPTALNLATPDLRGVSTTVLVKLAASLTHTQDAAYYDPEQDLALDVPAAGAWKVDAVALYDELAHRLFFNDDKDARQALSLSILGGDDRARQAKDLAFDDKRAASLQPLTPTGAESGAGVTPTARP